MTDNKIINQIIQTKIILIKWKEWSGKTMFGVYIASHYDRIISNIDIYEDWKKINQSFNTIADLVDLPFNPVRWVIVFDEVGINANSRQSMTYENVLLSKFIALSRKTNLNLIFIWQREWMIDKNIKEAAHWKFDMYSYFSWPNYIKFKIKLYKIDNWWNEYLTKIMGFDWLRRMKQNGISYNTLEKSDLSDTMGYKSIKWIKKTKKV